MTPGLKWIISVAVVGFFAVAALVALIVQWHTTKTGAATLGSLAFLSGLAFNALGWNKQSIDGE